MSRPAVCVMCVALAFGMISPIQGQTGGITVSPIAATARGNTLTATYTVSNTSGVSWTFGVGAEIRQGATVVASLPQQSLTVSANSTSTGSYQYTIPCGWANGNRVFRAVLWTGTPGTSTWLGFNDRTFTVLPPIVSANVTVSPIPSVVAGNQITAPYSVMNTGSCSRSFGVGAEIRSGTTVVATLGSQTTSPVSPGNSTNGTFTYSIPAGWASGTYTFRAVVWSGNPGTSTWLGNHSRNFSVTTQIISASITVSPITSTPVGSTLTANYSVTNTGNVAWSFGVGAEIRQGSTVLATLSPPQTTPTIAPGSTWSSGSYSHTIPCGWTSGARTFRATVWDGSPGIGTWLNNDNRGFTILSEVIAASASVNPIPNVASGNSITANYSIMNTGTCPRSFGVGAEIRQGNTVVATLAAQTTSTVQPASSVQGSYTYSIPWIWLAGNYTFRVTVWTGAPGASTWLGNGDVVLTVTGGMIGRVAFHAYTSYSAADGNVYVADLSTGVRSSIPAIDNAVVHAHNPHFSPDGRTIAFMGLPVGGSYGGGFLNYLELYTYSFATDQVTRLTYNLTRDEDPRFSVDGLSLLFKKNGAPVGLPPNLDIHRLTLATMDAQRLSSGPYEDSGPVENPDGSGRIAYWSLADPNGDIWMMNANGSGAGPICGAGGSCAAAVPALEEIYPWFIGPSLVAYSRWVGPAVYNSQIYVYDIVTNTSSPAAFNDPSADDSDPFDVSGNTIGFSSSRAGTYDLFIGDIGSSPPLHLSQISTNRQDLGGSYSQVVSVSPNAPPVIASLSTSSAVVPQGATVALDAMGVVDPDGTITAVQFFNDMTGTGVISAGEAELLGMGVLTSGVWTLAVSTGNLPLGIMTVSARAQDNAGDWSTVQSTTMTIVSVPSVVVTTTTLPSAVEGVLYSSQLMATGGLGSYQWAVIAGALPANLSLDPSGALTGTPVGGTSVNSPYTFTVQASSGGASATQQLTLTVDTCGLTLTPTSWAPIPVAVVGGASISQQITATPAAPGATLSGTNTWSIVPGPGWPSGLSLSLSMAATTSVTLTAQAGLSVAAGTYSGGILTWSGLCNGQAATVTLNLDVTVADPIGASFVGSPTSGPVPLSVAFTDLSTGMVTSWLWDFGDGTTSTSQHPTHVYNIAGYYTVSLTVSGPGGMDTQVSPAYVTATAPMLVAGVVVPSTVQANASWPMFTVRLEDGLGNLITSSSAQVTLTLVSGTGTLSGNTETAVAGIATFDSVSYSAIELISVSATAAGFAPLASASVSVVSLMFEFSTSGGGVGDAHVAVPIPPVGAAQGYTLFSLNTSAPVGAGPVFGINPDILTLNLLLAPAVPGSVAHWIPFVPGVYPSVPIDQPPGTYAYLSGSSADGVAIALSSSFNLMAHSDVIRITF